MVVSAVWPAVYDPRLDNDDNQRGESTMNGASGLPRLIVVISSALVATAGWACAQETPRAPNGKADLTGTWTSRSLTPLERPDSQPKLVISRDEADKLEGRVATGRTQAAQRTDPKA